MLNLMKYFKKAIEMRDNLHNVTQINEYDYCKRLKTSIFLHHFHISDEGHRNDLSFLHPFKQRKLFSCGGIVKPISLATTLLFVF